MSMETGLSIIVPSFNPGKVIDRCLMAIDRELKDIDQPSEILVVDSSPSPLQLPQIPNLKLCQSNVQLFASEARNLGARMAKYPTFVFLDADVEIIPGAIKILLDGFKENFDVVGGVYEIHNTDTSRLSTYQDLFLIFRYENIPPGKNFFSSGHFAVSRENFWKVGGFSENLQSYEDVDLGFKLQKKSLKAHVCLESRGYHLKNFDLKSMFRDYSIKTKNMIYYRLSRLNVLHWSDTFLTKSMRVSYYLVFCYLLLFTMIAIPGEPVAISFWLSMLGILIILDVGLLVHFMVFVWGVTRRPLWVIGALVFFKATTIPIIFGAIHGFYMFLKKDDSFVNEVKPSPDIDSMDITHNPGSQDS